MTPGEVYQLARKVGLPASGAIIATAIAGAESGYRPDAVGDRGLADAKWGPSIGLWQVRSLNRERGTGHTRDADRLTDPLFNARSMHAISNGGSNWSAWSTWNNGAYRAHMAEAVAAAHGQDGAASTSSPTYPGGSNVEQAGWFGLTPDSVINPFGLPAWLAGQLAGGGGDTTGKVLGEVGGAAGGLAGDVGTALLKSIGPLILATVAVGTGCALVLIGLNRAVAPTVDKAKDAVTAAAGDAAKVAAL